MEKKKILFFINTLNGGGAEKVLVDLLIAIDKQKYEIDLLTVSGGVHESRLPKGISYRKIIKKSNGLGKLLSKIVYHLPPSLFRKLYIKKKYDIEIAYLEGFPTRVIAKAKSAKKIAFVHFDASVKPVLQGIYGSAEKCHEEYKRFENVCFVSNQAKEGFEKIIGKLDNAGVVHNVINYEEVKQKSLEENDFEFETTGLKIISVGRLSPEKGYERLINIAGELEKQFDFELCILGEGQEREKLEQIIKEKEIKSVKLLGFQTNPYSYMKKADLYVCPSFYEGYSTTVAECVALGIPVLTTKCAGMDEILNGGNDGIIVENNEEGLKQGLINILEMTTSDLKPANKDGKNTSVMLKGLDEFISLLE